MGFKARVDAPSYALDATCPGSTLAKPGPEPQIFRMFSGHAIHLTTPAGQWYPFGLRHNRGRKRKLRSSVERQVSMVVNIDLALQVIKTPCTVLHTPRMERDLHLDLRINLSSSGPINWKEYLNTRKSQCQCS